VWGGRRATSKKKRLANQTKGRRREVDLKEGKKVEATDTLGKGEDSHSKQKKTITGNEG